MTDTKLVLQNVIVWLEGELEDTLSDDEPFTNPAFIVGLQNLINDCKASVDELESPPAVGEVGKSYRDVGGQTAPILWFTDDGNPPPEGTQLFLKD